MGQKKNNPECCICCFQKCAAKQLTKHMVLLLFLYTPTHGLGLILVGHKMLKVF